MLMVSVLSIGMVTNAAADEETTDVTVEVSEITQLDVRPSELDYTDSNIEPGDFIEESDDGYEAVEVENIGSNNIEEVSVEAEVPQQNPFGAEGLDEEDHVATNFVTVSTETATEGIEEEYSYLDPGIVEVETPHYLNRVDYTESPAPTYIDLPDEDEWGVGRLRAGGVEYFYALEGDTAGDDADADFRLRIGTAPHTSTTLGSTDFTDSEEYVEFDDSDQVTGGDSDFYSVLTDEGVMELVSFDPDSESYDGDDLVERDDGDGELVAVDDLGDAGVTEPETRQYGFYVYSDVDDSGDEFEDGHIYRTRFNIDPESIEGSDTVESDTSDAQQALFSSSTSSNQLQPGDSFPLNMGVQVPQGVDDDRLDSGLVTVLAEGDSS